MEIELLSAPTARVQTKSEKSRAEWRKRLTSSRYRWPVVASPTCGNTTLWHRPLVNGENAWIVIQLWLCPFWTKNMLHSWLNECERRANYQCFVCGEINHVHYRDQNKKVIRCRRWYYKGRKVLQRQDSACTSTLQQICLSCFLIISCSMLTRSSMPSEHLAFFTLQTIPALSPSVNTINPPPFWGENGARFRQRMDSVCLSFFQSMYLTVMQSLLNGNPDGHMVIHWRSTMELMMWPGRNLRWKWCECDSNVAHAFARKSIWVGSRIEDSPGTTSNPDRAVSVAVSLGRGVTAWVVDADGVVVTVILIGDLCCRSTHVYWLPPSLGIITKLLIWPFQNGLTWATTLEHGK